jgi:hypothetical protein
MYIPEKRLSKKEMLNKAVRSIDYQEQQEIMHNQCKQDVSQCWVSV